MKHLYLLALFTFSTVKSQNDTIWINNHEISVKEKATHYFTFEKIQNKNLYKIGKYTKDHIAVLKGTTFNNDYQHLVYTDKLYSYSEKGILLNAGNITNNKYNGEMVSYTPSGESFVSEFRDDLLYEGTYIFEQNNYLKTGHAEGGKYIKQVIQINDSEKIVLEFKDNIIISQKYFIQDKLINSGEYKNGIHYNGYFNDLSNEFKGINITSLYKDAVLMEQKTFYKNGKIKVQTLLENKLYTNIYYNLKSEEISKVTYKLDENNLPTYFDGTQCNFSESDNEKLKTAYTYKKGKLTHITYYEDNEILFIMHLLDEVLDTIAYYKNNTLFSSVTFDKEGYPIDGTVVDRFEEITYNNKKIIRIDEFYSDKKLFCTYDNATYKYTYYDQQGNIFEEHKTISEKTTFDKKIANGTIYILDENKQYIKTEETYKNGKLEKRYEFSFINDERVLLNEFLYKEGQLVRKRQYFPNSAIQSFETFSGQNLLAGIYYDENGNQIGKYDALKRNGTYIKYFPESTDIHIKVKWLNKMLLEYHEYEHSPYSKALRPKIEMKLNSKAAFYFNNEIVAEAELENGKIKNGKIFHNQDPNYYIYNNYEDYLKEGEELFYSKFTNELVYRNFYHKGILEFRELYKNNQLFLSIPVVNDVFSGNATMYDKNGDVKSMIDFKEGMVYNGTIEYTENNLNVKEVYKNGNIKLVEITNSKGITLLKKIPENGPVQKYEIYHPNGQPYYSFTSYGQLFHGKLLQYNSFGVLEQEHRFEYGVPKKGIIKTSLWVPNEYGTSTFILSTHTFNKDHVMVENYSQNQILFNKKEYNIALSDQRRNYAKVVPRIYTIYPLVYKYIDSYEPLLLKKSTNTELILNF